MASAGGGGVALTEADFLEEWGDTVPQDASLTQSSFVCALSPGHSHLNLFERLPSPAGPQSFRGSGATRVRSVRRVGLAG